ncbi:hypothetical protein NX862_14750 [Rhodobacter sp. KR11]|uniref:EF-hand domain-containing protein n=1 Tax=Rhodobacter sp. KR11 TaxID=2974588 RepID=UPI00222318FA|nr:hypothetical protein [Rhodobacter sp. KR11]MCW1920017.1 hypothetical protein [Rhodobacter sp. KR11]
MVQKGTVMISALSGAGSRALLSLFGRPKSQAPADDVSPVALRPAVSNTLPDANRGTTPESLFAALVDQTGAPADLSSQAISALDRDGSGTLSAAELMQAYQSVASSGTFSSVAGLVSGIVSRVDSDGDQAISANELTAAVAGLGGSAAADQNGVNPLLEQVMAQLDADGSNTLSRDEVAQALGLPIEGLPSAAPGFVSRPTAAPKSMYEAIFSLRVNPEGGQSTAEAREAIAAQMQDKLLG